MCSSIEENLYRWKLSDGKELQWRRKGIISAAAKVKWRSPPGRVREGGGGGGPSRPARGYGEAL